MTRKVYVETDWAGGFTPPLPVNWRGGPVALQVTVTGGEINFDIESTNSDINAGDAADWLVDTTDNAGVTASRFLTFNGIPRFIRVKVNSGGTGVTLTLKLVQRDV